MKIINKDIKYLESYNHAVNSVCKEGKYLSNDIGFDIESSKSFLTFNIESDNPQLFLLNDKEKVIGWCDITPKPQQFFKHIGILGMGILKEYRNNGYGKELLKLALKKAKERHIEKVELEVYESNTSAISLYEKAGFKIEGKRVQGFKNGDRYEDIILMGLLINKYS